MKTRLTTYSLFAFALLAAHATATIHAQDNDDAATDSAATAATNAQHSPAENSVVKIFATKRMPDFSKPWSKQSPSQSTASGVVIEGNRILTNAHVVLYASQIQVQPNQSGDKYIATVEYVAPGIDLAVLKLNDEELFKRSKPLPRSTALPQIKDSVMAYGFPTGGTTLSITKGIVSRIEHVSYGSQTTGMRIQIDAAVNPGNSGGPAVNGETMIGLAYSRGTGDNIGYIIPTSEIEIFLNDIADGRYDGKGFFADHYQMLENPALQAYLKTNSATAGLVVFSPCTWLPENPLKKLDIITHIGANPIDRQGMVKTETGLRVRFDYYVSRLEKNGKVPVTVLRDNKEMKIDYPLSKKRPVLLDDLDGAYPQYFVYGPIVLSAACREHVMPLQKNGLLLVRTLEVARIPILTRFGEEETFPGEQLVIVASPFLPHKITKGYGNIAMDALKTINGIKVKNLSHMVELLRDNQSEFVVFEFQGRMSPIVAFKRAEIESSTEEILNDNGIRDQGSAELMKIWNAKK